MVYVTGNVNKKLRFSKYHTLFSFSKLGTFKGSRMFSVEELFQEFHHCMSADPNIIKNSADNVVITAAKRNTYLQRQISACNYTKCINKLKQYIGC